MRATHGDLRQPCCAWKIQNTRLQNIYQQPFRLHPVNGIDGKMICERIPILKFWCRLMLPVFHWARGLSRTRSGIADITLSCGPTRNTKWSIRTWATTIWTTKTKRINNCPPHLAATIKTLFSGMPYYGWVAGKNSQNRSFNDYFFGPTIARFSSF